MKESENKMSENRNHNTVRLAKMGMLVAIAIVLVYFIHFPIFPAVAFLEYDPADIPILMGTFAFGPGCRDPADGSYCSDTGSDGQRSQRSLRDHHAHYFH